MGQRRALTAPLEAFVGGVLKLVELPLFLYQAFLKRFQNHILAAIQACFVLTRNHKYGLKF